MKKLIFQLFIFIIIIVITWFTLSRINWMSVFKVQQITKSTEEKLGEVLWKLFSKTEKNIHSLTIQNQIDSLVEYICKYNSINKSKIKVHILQNNQVNAFSLPNGHLVIYTGLIDASENETELIGVLGHEIAHIEKNHIMKKLIKEIGLTVLISITSGNSGGEVIKKAAEKMSSSAYDRDMEREADITAVDYLIKANINPEPFANFLYRLSFDEKKITNQIYWISTHPDSKERAERIVNYIKGKPVSKKHVLSQEGWIQLKKELIDKN
jgi:beta-barrel assembly-enhancing protease